MAQNPAACSRPLDLSQVNARLAEVSDNSAMASRARPRDVRKGPGETPPYGEEEQLADLRDDETEAWHGLVNDGGRPLYPIHLLEQVSRDPEEYREMLWPFSPRDHGPSWLVFQSQLKRWQDFRNWQNDNRGLEDQDDGYSAHVERRKRHCIKYENTKELAEIEADPECLRSDWERYEHKSRMWQRRWQREPDCDGFSDYVDAMKRRLARHGFTRPPFQLCEDPKQQDQLTTWIEYLCFEYWWLDRHTKSIERLKQDHDKFSQELVDLQLLKPPETKRSIPESKHIRMLQAATNKVRAAQEQHESAKRRRDMVTKFIQATSGYESAKKDAARQNILLQWVLEQFPLIEPKLQPAKTEPAPNATGSRKRRVTFGEASSGQSHKKQKPDQGELGFRASSVAAPIQASPATPDDQPRSRDETQGSRGRKSPARRMLRSVHEKRAVSLGIEHNTQRIGGPGQESSTTGNAAGHQRRAGCSPTDQGRLGKRSSKRQKLKHRELGSPSGSRPVSAEAGENLTEANSAMNRTGIHGPGTDTTSAEPRRSARIAAREASGPVSYFPRSRMKPAKSPTSLSVGGRSSRGLGVSKARGMSQGSRRSQRRGG